MPRLTDQQIYDTIHAENVRHGSSASIGQEATAVMIVIAESNGYTDARNLDHPVPPGSPAYWTNNNKPGKGNDRGIWQINDKAHPDVPDATADDPAQATAWAWKASDGYAPHGWKPWAGSAGLSALASKGGTNGGGSAAEKARWADIYNRAIAVTGDAGKLPTVGLIPGAVDTVQSQVSSTLVPWAEGLAKFLSYVTSAAFWRRFGTGALGVLFILIALALVRASSIPSMIPGV